MARRGGGGGITAPRSPGAVKVAPDVLVSARAFPGSSGGLARRWRVRERTPAAERSRAPPCVIGKGGLRDVGPSVARQ
jgi:hypothetical protein